MRKVLAFSLSLWVFVAGCNDRDKSGRILDTPTSGSIKIAIDESLRPLIDAEVSTFEALYQRPISSHIIIPRQKLLTRS
ncbi:MAG TPA: hypothetical protein VF490_05645 [Chryseosolibacter sp.]